MTAGGKGGSTKPLPNPSAPRSVPRTRTRSQRNCAKDAEWRGYIRLPALAASGSAIADLEPAPRARGVRHRRTVRHAAQAPVGVVIERLGDSAGGAGREKAR